MNQQDIKKNHQEVKEKKIFVGNLNKLTTKSIKKIILNFFLGKLKEYFSQFGEVDKAFIIYHHKSGESRGFGFVEFLDRESVSRTLIERDNLVLDGSRLDCDSVVLKGESFHNVKIQFYYFIFNFFFRRKICLRTQKEVRKVRKITTMKKNPRTKKKTMILTIIKRVAKIFAKKI